jgi:predicted CoA-binding protein
MKTLVIGASENPGRYSNRAMRLLKEKGHDVIGIGLKKGVVGETRFTNQLEHFEEVDTVTMYVGPQNQDKYHDYITNVIQPRRVIFNPGAENPEFQAELKSNGIEVEVACTLVLLGLGEY